jgi:hypothetical protein
MLPASTYKQGFISERSPKLAKILIPEGPRRQYSPRLLYFFTAPAQHPPTNGLHWGTGNSLRSHWGHLRKHMKFEEADEN